MSDLRGMARSLLRDGQVIEQGGHADLLALGGQYAGLYTLQASQYSL